MTKSPAGLVTVCNTQSRCDELVASEEMLANKKMTGVMANALGAVYNSPRTRSLAGGSETPSES